VKVKVKEVKTPAHGNELINRILNVERITQKTSVSYIKKIVPGIISNAG